MFRFAASGWLWWALLALPGLTAAAWLAARSRRSALARFADSALVKKLTETVSVPARRAKTALQVGALGLLFVALARPQFGTRVETVRSVGQDIVVAIDLSRSMLAEDVSPNRLERARLSIFRLMEQLDGDRIALVAFAADAFVQSPLTTDYSAAGMFLNAMHPDMMPVQGTDLGEALRVSLDALEEGGSSKVLVLVTDGEDHEERIDEQLTRVREMGVQLHVVGIGTSEGVPIPEYDEAGRRQGFLRDEDGSVVTTRLDEAILADIAPGAGGYVRAGAGGTAFEDLVDRIAGGTGDEVEAREITQFEEQYQLFLAFALLLLFGESMVSDRRRSREEWTGRFA